MSKDQLASLAVFIFVVVAVSLLLKAFRSLLRFSVHRRNSNVTAPTTTPPPCVNKIIHFVYPSLRSVDYIAIMSVSLSCQSQAIGSNNLWIIVIEYFVSDNHYRGSVLVISYLWLNHLIIDC